jgi:hypothetical protein
MLALILSFSLNANEVGVLSLGCPANSTEVTSSCVSLCFQVVPVLTGTSVEVDVMILENNPPRRLTIQEYQEVKEILDDICAEQ